MEFPSPAVELPDCQMNWEFLKQKIIGIGSREKSGPGVQIRFGVVTVNFPISIASNNVVVSHGLGRVPIAIVATSNTGFGIYYQTNTWTNLVFTIVGTSTVGALNQNADASWIAIG